MSLDEAAVLAVAAIYLSSEEKEGTDHIRMAQIKTESGLFEIVSSEIIKNFAKTAKEKYPPDKE